MQVNSLSKNLTILGMQIDGHLKRKSHRELIHSNLCAACCALRRILHVLNIDDLQIVYFAYFHAINKYSIILGGNSANIG